jgi:hypothetical protein
MDLSTIKNTGNWGSSAANLNENFSKVGLEVDKLKYAAYNSKLYATEALLKQAVPSPKVGDWAIVGDSIPGEIYQCRTDGVWTATGQTGGGYGMEVTEKYVNEITEVHNEYTGDIVNNPDDEDLVSVEKPEGAQVLKLADKTYNASAFSGMGRAYLRKNMAASKNVLTQAMVGSANTRYIIQYDYDLNGETITVPEGCTLDFQGGSISNGKIIFNDTELSGRINMSIEVGGKISNDSAIISWFHTSDYAQLITELSTVVGRIVVDKPITCGSGIHLHGNIDCMYPINFIGDNIDDAVYVDEELDIDNLIVDCSGVSSCGRGFVFDKQFNTTRIISHNINVSNLQNNDSGRAAIGALYVLYSSTNYDRLCCKISGSIRNIKGVPNGTVGDTGGQVKGLHLSLNKTGVYDHCIDIHDLVVENIVESTGTIGEDSDALHIYVGTNKSVLSKHSIKIRNSIIRYGGKRCVKIQSDGVGISNCAIYQDNEGFSETERSSSIGISIDSGYNTTIDGCRIYHKYHIPANGIYCSSNTSHTVVRNTLISFGDSFNHLRLDGATDVDIEIQAYSNLESESPADNKAVAYITGGTSGRVIIHADAEKLSGGDIRSGGRLVFSAFGILRLLAFLSYAENLDIRDSRAICGFEGVVGSNVKKLNISNNNLNSATLAVITSTSSDVVISGNSVKNDTAGRVPVILQGVTRASVKDNRIVIDEGVQLVNASSSSDIEISNNSLESPLSSGSIIQVNYIPNAIVLDNKIKATSELSTPIQHLVQSGQLQLIKRNINLLDMSEIDG